MPEAQKMAPPPMPKPYVKKTLPPQAIRGRKVELSGCPLPPSALAAAAEEEEERKFPKRPPSPSPTRPKFAPKVMSKHGVPIHRFMTSMISHSPYVPKPKSKPLRPPPPKFRERKPWDVPVHRFITSMISHSPWTPLPVKPTMQDKAKQKVSIASAATAHTSKILWGGVVRETSKLKQMAEKEATKFKNKSKASPNKIDVGPAVGVAVGVATTDGVARDKNGIEPHRFISSMVTHAPWVAPSLYGHYAIDQIRNSTEEAPVTPATEPYVHEHRFISTMLTHAPWVAPSLHEHYGMARPAEGTLVAPLSTPTRTTSTTHSKPKSTGLWDALRRSFVKKPHTSEENASKVEKAKSKSMKKSATASAKMATTTAREDGDVDYKNVIKDVASESDGVLAEGTAANEPINNSCTEHDIKVSEGDIKTGDVASAPTAEDDVGKVGVTEQISEHAAVNDDSVEKSTNIKSTTEESETSAGNAGVDGTLDTEAKETPVATGTTSSHDDEEGEEEFHDAKETFKKKGLKSKLTTLLKKVQSEAKRTGKHEQKDQHNEITTSATPVSSNDTPTPPAPSNANTQATAADVEGEPPVADNHTKDVGSENTADVHAPSPAPTPEGATATTA
eukprot:CFRG4164T1